jgi:hypothetical protein
MLRLLLLVIHIAAAAIAFGAPLGIPRLLKASAAAGMLPFQIAVNDVAKRARLARMSGITTLFSGVIMMLLNGGFAVVSKNYHAAFGLMWLLLGISFFVTTPAVKKVKALAAASTLDQAAAVACANKIGMAIGIGHLLWTLILVLMFQRF